MKIVYENKKGYKCDNCGKRRLVKYLYAGSGVLTWAYCSKKCFDEHKEVRDGM